LSAFGAIDEGSDGSGRPETVLQPQSYLSLAYEYEQSIMAAADICDTEHPAWAVPASMLARALGQLSDDRHRTVDRHQSRFPRMAGLRRGYGADMATVKSRIALAGGKYLVTHPRSRLTRVVVRFVVRRVSKKVVTATHLDAIPATRGSRLVTVAGIAVVAGGIVIVVRKSTKSAEAQPADAVPSPHAPFPPAAGTPPETRDAPPTTPTTSPAAEAAAVVAAADVSDNDDALVARVEAKLFGGAPGLGVEVEAASGVVTLRGQVVDEEAEGRFVRDAEQVEGVKAVQSELQTAGAEPGPPAS